jgi:hypothetical protein
MRDLIPAQEPAMRKHLLLAGFAAAALIPSIAVAQETCEQRSANRTTGTAVGAVAGALLGSAVAGHGEKGTGAVIGGIGGAIIGNQLARGPRDCQHAYGWYDSNARWHANAVDRSVASGYYDRDGVWVEGEPRGYYDDHGAWVTNAGPSGWYDSNGQWHPTSVDRAVAAGYYDRDGAWVAGAPRGHYDSRGTWVADAVETYGADAGYDTGYSEFRNVEDHIRREIDDGVRDDLLEQADASDFRDQLRRIQAREARDKAEIRAQLDQLDRQVDRTRNEP